MEHSNRPIRGFTPVYDNSEGYTVIQPKVAKEELYLSKSLQKAMPEQAPAPRYNPEQIAQIIQSFLDA